MSLAQPGCNIYYANLFIFLSGIICVFGAATYFIIVFGAAMTLPLLVLGLSAPTVFLGWAQNYILGHGANCIFDLGALKARKACRLMHAENMRKVAKAAEPLIHRLYAMLLQGKFAELYIDFGIDPKICRLS